MGPFQTQIRAAPPSAWTNILSALKVSPSRQQLAEHVYTRAVPNSRSDGACAERSSPSPTEVGGLRKGSSEGRIWSSHWTGPRQYEHRSGTAEGEGEWRLLGGGLDRKRGVRRGSRVYLVMIKIGRRRKKLKCGFNQPSSYEKSRERALP